MSRKMFLVGAFLLSGLLSGCMFGLGEETAGEQGRLRFAYRSGLGCFFGCGLDRAMVPGTQETIGVQGDDALRIAGVRSRVPGRMDARLEVSASCCVERRSSRGASSSCVTATRTASGTFSCASGMGKLRHHYRVEVMSKEAGESRLELLDPQGRVFDSVVLSSRRPHRLRVEFGEKDQEKTEVRRIVMHLGKSYEVLGVALDAQGRVMQFSGLQVQMTLKTGIALVDLHRSIGLLGRIPDYRATLTPKTVGSTTLTLSLRGTLIEVPVEIRP